MDTLLSMIRRMLKSLVPTGSGPAGLLARLHTIVTPDKAHIHHRLIAKGLSQRTVVFVLYLVSCVFGAAAFALQVSNSSTNAFIVAATSIASVVGVRRLQYREIAVLRNGLLLPIYDSSLMHRTLFHAFLDLCYILIAFSASYLLTTPGEMYSGREFFFSLAMVGFLQLSIFCACGLYRETIRLFGLGDLLNILKAATAAVGITALFFMVTSRFSATLGVTGLILDFYILASLVAGTRASFHILRYLSRRERSDLGLVHDDVYRILGGAGVPPDRIARHDLVPRGRHLRHHDAPRLRPARECDDLVLVHPAIRTRCRPERLGGLCRARRAELHIHRVLPDDDVAERDRCVVNVAPRRPLPRERHRRGGDVLPAQTKSAPRDVPPEPPRPLPRGG